MSGRLVEQEQRRVPQERPGERDPLPLPRRQPQAPLPERGVVAVRQRPDEAVRVSAHLQDADVRYALKALFASTGGNYTIDQLTVGQTTVDLDGVPFKQALEAILSGTRAVAALKYRIVDGVYIISPVDP